ncbi:MAG: carboxypeptidase-like regulatory domain-containing protein [Bryobacteraceae bacterium]
MADSGQFGHNRLVTDSSGGVIPGVAVKARNTASGVAAETVSSSTGNYVIPNLGSGSI